MKPNPASGLTAIEMLIVTAIITILGAMFVPSIIRERDRARDSATQSHIRQCITSVETARDATTHAMPKGAANCEDDAAAPGGLGSAALPLTAATQSTEILFSDTTDRFVINATSASGNAFTFDGTVVKAGTSDKPTP